MRVWKEGEFLRVGDPQPIRVDLRIIAATNRDLEKAVERREFRQDLYYRLKGIALHLPPLRERTEDIPLLAYHFLKKFRGNRKAELIDPQAIKALMAYKWPGNIRELEHVIEYALSMTEGDTIRVTDLPEEFLARVADKVAVQDNWMSSPFGKAKEEFEKFYITHILEESDWNVSEASRKAQMFRQNLQQKIRKYGLRPEGEEEPKDEEEKS